MLEIMKTLIVVLLALSTVLVAGCSSQKGADDAADESQNEKAQYQKISPEKAQEMMKEESFLLDVRTQEEYDAGHIEGAVLIPVNDILADQFEKLPNKDQVILVYCRSGNRSEVAARHLVESGYTQVYDFGGINDWPYDIVQ